MRTIILTALGAFLSMCNAAEPQDSVTVGQLRQLCETSEVACMTKLSVMYAALVELQQSGKKSFCPAQDPTPAQLEFYFMAAATTAGDQADPLPAALIAIQGFAAAMPCP